MKLIPCTQGQFAIVPDNWFEELNKHKWCATWSEDSKTFYAVRGEYDPARKQNKMIQMHRVILNAPPGVKVDHADHNGMNNVPPNIRICPPGANAWNQRKRVTNISGFKGVCWHKLARKWRARISVNGKHIHLGFFVGNLDAARAYNEAAIKHYGEFACLNEILEDLMCHC